MGGPAGWCGATVRTALVAGAVLLVGSSAAFGLGFGGYVDVGTGGGELTVENGVSRDFDIGTDHFGIGFALDTALTDEGLFNYRLNVGLESIDIGVDAGNDADVSGITIANDFGFAFLQQERMRFWAGPQLRLGAYFGDNEVDHDVEVFAAGLGPVVGGNFAVADRAVLSARLGVIYSVLWGEESNNVTLDLSGDDLQLFLNLSIFFVP